MPGAPGAGGSNRTAPTPARSLPGGMAPLTDALSLLRLVLNSSLQNREKINWCCCQPPSVWSLVTAGLQTNIPLPLAGCVTGNGLL